MSDRPNNTLNERHVSLLVRFKSAFTPEISHEGHLEPEEMIFFLQFIIQIQLEYLYWLDMSLRAKLSLKQIVDQCTF